MVHELIRERRNLLADAPSLRGGGACPRCRESLTFKLARDEEIVALLGYR